MPKKTLPTLSRFPPPQVWIDLRPRWPLTDRKDPRGYIAPRSAKKKNIFTSLEAQLAATQQGAQQAQQAAAEQGSQQAAAAAAAQ